MIIITILIITIINTNIMVNCANNNNDDKHVQLGKIVFIKSFICHCTENDYGPRWKNFVKCIQLDYNQKNNKSLIADTVISLMPTADLIKRDCQPPQCLVEAWCLKNVIIQLGLLSGETVQAIHKCYKHLVANGFRRDMCKNTVDKRLKASKAFKHNNYDKYVANNKQM
ncbi:uncharacterized protein LOC128954479 [Oppia nitens]|uniref:uncharacterized protein LOC128954479 n=1 Tax=Oppia nitens TaxID=1686743 RepID=UPI0023DAC1EC|nr:uncharacterized protein LOC128954479 [Oppia nitens]